VRSLHHSTTSMWDKENTTHAELVHVPLVAFIDSVDAPEL